MIVIAADKDAGKVAAAFTAAGETVVRCSARSFAPRQRRASPMTARSIFELTMSRKRVAVLISGRGSNMAALIEAAKDKTYPAEIVLVVSNRPDAGGLDDRARRRHRHRGGRSHAIRQGPRRLRARAASGAGKTPHRDRLPCRLHAAAHARFRRAVAGAPAQHPSGAAAGLQGPRHPQARARTPAQATRRDRAFRRAGNGFRAHHRPRRGCGARRRHAKKRWPRACLRSSTGFIRRR